jgi:NAD(P)-dependent dehydrogenase (short-subunit alcohol dehydrogenase family)
VRPLDEQTILIAGATDGLGRALAARLAGAGATWCADAGLDGVRGRYFNGTRQARALPQADDPDARQRLRRLSEDLVDRALGTSRGATA